MRGTWDDLNRRLAGGMLGLDMDDSLVIGERRALVGKGLFHKKVPDPSPRRYVQVTAARDFLIGECVGSTTFGGEWEMSPETEAHLERIGWERPWSPKYPTYSRQVSLASSPKLALAMARTLEILGCEMENLEAELVHEEPEG
ncbi:hypothetical protein GCM10027020_23580 [Nocardioides salsibiostraticola]